MSGQSSLLLRERLLASGHTPSSIQHRVNTGIWIRVFDGVYVPSETLDKSLGAAALVRGGPRSALSHHTAAIVHRFDSSAGWDARSTWLTVPHTVARFSPQFESGGSQVVVKRTRLVPDPSSLFVADGLRFTGRVRTLVDLAGLLDAAEFAIVLESGLRGPDPKNPEVWRNDVLTGLEAWAVAHPRQPGSLAVRQAIAHRRPGRPTGSIAESAVIFALIGAGITEVIVQPRIVAPDRFGGTRVQFADLLIPAGQLVIEIDGSDHDSPARRRADHERDRRLSPGFHVFRYSASVALSNPQHIVDDVTRHLAATRPAGESWLVGDARVEGAGHEWTITRTNPTGPSVASRR